jgi:glyoxylase-like metal-dependent hydrolase (beta-lactamase superfamily II)
MTLDGTNTWVVGDLDGGRVVVVDPGPDDEQHLDAVAEIATQRGARVDSVLLTHGHLDHSAGARTFARRCGTVVRALDPAHRLGAEGLGEGDVVDAGGVRIDVMATPGHSSDSLCFALAEQGVLLTGDTVLGRGTAVIYHPDGVLAHYLESLRRLARLVDQVGCSLLLPGHGPVLEDPAGVVRYYLDHRLERLIEVQAAVDAGARTAAEVVERVYADVPRTVWPAAERSVRAALVHLGYAPQ